MQAAQYLLSHSLRARGGGHSPFCRFMESFQFEKLSATGSVDGMARGCVDAGRLSRVKAMDVDFNRRRQPDSGLGEILTH